MLEILAQNCYYHHLWLREIDGYVLTNGKWCKIATPFQYDDKLNFVVETQVSKNV
jgi:hypothetical protein